MVVKPGVLEAVLKYTLEWNYSLYSQKLKKFRTKCKFITTRVGYVAVLLVNVFLAHVVILPQLFVVSIV
jgi:hypothetical protein